MLHDSGAHAAPNIHPTLFGDMTPAPAPAKAADPPPPAAPAAPVEPSPGPASTEPAAASEPASRRDDVLAVLQGAGADAKLSVDTIHVDVNVGDKPHLAKGPLEVLLGELAAEGRIVRHDDGTFSLATEERTEREQPGLARAARCAVVALLLGYPPIEAPEVFDIAIGLHEANQSPAAAVIPVAWVDGFTGDLGRTEPERFEARARHHLDALVRADLAMLVTTTKTALADEMAENVAQNVADQLDANRSAILAAMTGWSPADFEHVEMWLKAGEDPASKNASEYAAARAAWIKDIPGVLVPFLQERDVPEGGVALPEPRGAAPDASATRGYALTREAVVLAFEQGVEAVVRRSYGDAGVPTVAELTERFDQLLTDATRRARAEGEASLKTWQDLASSAQRELTRERLVTSDYERWFRGKGVQDPRTAIARAFGQVDVFEVEDFEETRDVDGAELHRIIAEWEALQDLLKAVLAKNTVDKGAMKTAELELTGKIEALAQAIKLAGRGRHVVKKKIRRTIRDGFELILSADAHDEGTELRRTLLPQGAPWQQVAVPGAAAKGEPEWSPPPKTVSVAATTETSETPAAPPVGAVTPVAPVETTTEEAPPPPVDEEPPAWTGDTALTLGNLRHMLVGIPGKPGLGLLQTSLGAQGIPREEVADKLAAYIGHAAVDDGFLRLVSKALNATERAGDLLSGTRDGKGLVWHKDVAMPADTIPSEETAKALAAHAAKAEKPTKAAAAKKATEQRPNAPPKRGAAKADPAKKTAKPADKGRSGKAPARK